MAEALPGQQEIQGGCPRGLTPPTKEGLELPKQQVKPCFPAVRDQGQGLELSRPAGQQDSLPQGQQDMGTSAGQQRRLLLSHAQPSTSQLQGPG